MAPGGRQCVYLRMYVRIDRQQTKPVAQNGSRCESRLHLLSPFYSFFFSDDDALIPSWVLLKYLPPTTIYD